MPYTFPAPHRVADVPPEHYGNKPWQHELDSRVAIFKQKHPDVTDLDAIEAAIDNEMLAWEDTRDLYALGLCKTHNGQIAFRQPNARRALVLSWPCNCYRSYTTLHVVSKWRRERKGAMSPDRRASLYRFLGRAEPGGRNAE